jgi:type I restriction enzyme S subunit
MQTLKLTKKYETYPEYKDSGIEWLGKIPTNWEAQKIVSVFNFSNQKVTEATHEPLSVTYDGIKRQIENAAKVAEGSLRKLVKVGDIAINGRSDRKGAVGMSEYEGGVSLVYNVLRKRDQLSDSKYFHYLFRSKLFSEEFYRWGRGIVDDLWTTRESEMKRICITVPKSEEQTKIAKYLDEKISSVDQILERKERLIEFLREKRTAQIKNIIKSFDVDGKGYTKEKIKHVVKSIESGVWGENPLGNSDDIRCLRVADFDYANLSFSNVETVRNNEKLSKRKILQHGDILIEKSGGGEKTPVGRAILFNSDERMVCANFVDVVRVDRNKILPDFLVFYLSILYSERINTKYIKQNTGIQNMDIKAYFGEIVSFPDLKVQKEIVDDIKKKMALFDQSIKKVQETIEFLKEFKASLISNTVTGKIKV